MKYVIITLLLMGCTLPKRVYNKSKPVMKKSDKVESCIKQLIGNLEVKPLEAADICIKVRQ